MFHKINSLSRDSQYKEVVFETQYQTLFYANGFLPGTLFIVYLLDIRSGVEQHSNEKKWTRNRKLRSFAVLCTTKTHLSLWIFFSGVGNVSIILFYSKVLNAFINECFKLQRQGKGQSRAGIP